MMGRFASAVATVLLLAALLILLYGALGGGRTDLPWRPLDLGELPDAFTGRKLTALGGNRAQCLRLLDSAGIVYVALPPRRDGSHCGYDDGVRLSPGGSRSVSYSPARPPLSCPVAASLSDWEWEVVQPAARAQFGSSVVRIHHYGSYNCRRIAGSDSGWSEHAHGDAIDIAAFTLADGRTISVASDWRGAQERSVFLHNVRDGACRLFATVLSPDYNAAHADHLHLDQAARGEMGWRACR